MGDKWLLSASGTRNKTLNGSCPDCYSERNSLASRDYVISTLVIAALIVEQIMPSQKHIMINNRQAIASQKLKLETTYIHCAAV